MNGLSGGRFVKLGEQERSALFGRFQKARKTLQEEGPLIHSITNPISINDCANSVLALGGRPIMAEHPREAAQITRMARALTVSLANITDARARSIFLSGREKRAVMDAVGAGCSPFRLELAERFIRECSPAVIKGNMSEIQAVMGTQYCAAGIDVGQADAVTKENLPFKGQILEQMCGFAAHTRAVVMASGEVDLIASDDGKTVWLVKNGTASLAKVTGTGCMLTCIIGAYLAAADPETACVLAAVTLGIAGELADKSRGLGTFHMGLIDQLSLLGDDQIFCRMQVEKWCRTET